MRLEMIGLRTWLLATVVGWALLVCVLAVAAAVGVACVAGPARAALACGIAALVFALWRRACLQRLGGMTGDTCGALIELSETAVLAGLALYAG